jgi:pimeloyl-ACP methyl ester carboxylesterase/DNA-binding winged helix-turn-helix (wHTH) protein
MSDTKRSIYSFGRFRLDAGQRLLFSDEAIVTLTPKAFDTLLVLVEQRGKVLSKEELMQLVWEDQIVEENNLAQNIHQIRKALRDAGGGDQSIETMPKRGYRFVGEVEISSPAPAGSDAPAAGGNPVEEKFTPPVKPRIQYATSTGNVNIAYQVVGDGPLDLVFVMGWVSHLEYFWKEPSFARFLTRLSTFSRLILFDKRGTGLSDPVPLGDLPTLEQRMTDVQAVMDAVGSKRAALVGVSEGGPMCALFAATYPERTAALVMIGAYARRTWAEDYPWVPTAEERGAFLEMMHRTWGGPVGIELRAPSVANDERFREWWASYLRLGASPGAALALTKMNAEIDVRHVLPSIRVPSLILHRIDDACLPIEGSRYVADSIPGAKFVELPGRDHLPFVGDQDSLLDEIEEFLTGARAEHPIDRVLVTALFLLFDGKDILERPEEIREMAQIYLRRELNLFRGKEIKTTSQYSFATFDGPARAIRCAIGLADAATRLNLRIRAGLHTGECDLIGDAIAGATIDVARAVAQQADFGEILLSHTVKDLVAGSGLHFEPRGAQSFDPAAGEWRMFAVLRGDPTPLAAAAPR